MKISALKKYFFGNVIAFLGYGVLINYIYYYLVVSPKELEYEREMIQKHGEVLISGFYEATFFLIYILLISLFLFLLLFEFLIRKKIKPTFFKAVNSSTKLLKIYSVLFWIGLFFTLIPLVLSVYIFFTLYSVVLFPF